MQFLSTVPWSDVFAGWREREASNPGWIHCATDIKGWPDWESWRLFSVRFFGAETREWKRYAINDPENELPHLLLGPYGRWQTRVSNNNQSTFLDLLSQQEQREHFSQHEAVQGIRSHLPFDTEFIALKRMDTQQLVLVDGHHRVTAITLDYLERIQRDYSTCAITIAIAEIPVDECHLFDDALERGSHKHP